MSRPKLTPHEWLRNDQNLKLEFLKFECNSTKGLVYFDQGNNTIKNIDSEYSHNSYTHNIQLNGGIFLKIDDICFNKLKAKYRVFKKNKKDSNLVSKNFKLKKQTAEYIRSVKERNGWSREEDVIEDMINNIQNIEVNKKTITQLHSKEIKLATLNSEIKNNMMHIHHLSEDKNTLTREIYEMKELLAAAYLKNDFYIEKLKHHNLSIEQPNITEEIIRKKLLEIEYARKAHI